VGNDKSVKSVFSGHWVVLLLLRKKAEAQQPKGTSRQQKAICANYGRLSCAYLLEDLQRVN
jgi:hypothetical protein